MTILKMAADKQNGSILTSVFFSLKAQDVNTGVLVSWFAKVEAWTYTQDTCISGQKTSKSLFYLLS